LDGRERDSGWNVNKVKRGPRDGREKRAETLEIPWPSFSGLAFKIGMNSEGRTNRGIQASQKEVWTAAVLWSMKL